jgi:mevalonate kinase
MTIAQAPGKVILFGEHAVVYGRPAIAIPVQQVCATAEISQLPNAPSGQVFIQADDIALAKWLHEMNPDHPLARIINLTLQEIDISNFLPLKVKITSSIPIAAGLGSSAAISVSIARALTQHLGRPLSSEQVSSLAFEVEKLHHGTPSGIDNTVVAYNRPVYFVRGNPPECFSIGAPFTLLIADSGQASPTSIAVSKVRQQWESDPKGCEQLFDSIGEIADHARGLIKAGKISQLGPLMNKNQECLDALGVSSDLLDRLIQTALQAGAFGAKLSGAGLGGNMIALVNADCAADVQSALARAGATRRIRTEAKT